MTSPTASSHGTTSSSPTPPHRGGSPWATGGTVFAGVMMLVYGVLAVFQGIAGIAHDDVYARQGDYVFKFDLTTWGWIHLILGVVVAAAGLGILMGNEWARLLGVALAALAVIANFAWLPYLPVWAIVNIAIGVFVIWALCTDRSRSLV
ncbi:hypothetical protein DMB38_08635 [Streptomyces sp. WAC 06738]|uniref:DUF7144 family membrane protein n=1 Tax=Streptomyces sp. WAC 06738 TaxID=2203210 RepID=UPI000F705A56|nr:hypothetical protein [Streptomyces sp. WAC 06738]AZM45885.1 hypothetical protein DMB38_08635 [Streptomyces sp. WAC 06738]